MKADPTKRALIEALDGLLGFLEAYPHPYRIDISGYLDAGYEALSKARKRARPSDARRRHIVTADDLPVGVNVSRTLDTSHP